MKGHTEELETSISDSKSAVELLADMVNACAEAKAMDIAALDVSKAFNLANYFLIVSARSDRQVQGISNRILLALQEQGIAPDSIEGLEKAHWVLLDYGEVVVHVFYEPVRDHYDLESLWSEARRINIEKELHCLEAGALGPVAA